MCVERNSSIVATLQVYSDGSPCASRGLPQLEHHERVARDRHPPAQVADLRGLRRDVRGLGRRVGVRELRAVQQPHRAGARRRLRPLDLHLERDRLRPRVDVAATKPGRFSKRAETGLER